MTAKDLHDLVGATGTIVVEDSLEIGVEVKDVKPAYGRLLYLITPVGGTGSKWVNAERVKLK